MNQSAKTPQPFKKNATFTTMTTLSFIGNAVWAILFGIIFSGSLNNSSEMLNSLSVDGLFGGLLFLFAILSGIVLFSCIISIIGLVKMRKGKKKGFKYYLVGNGIWILIMIYTAFGDSFYAIFGAIISLLFLAFFYFKSRQMA